jgi:hypothetical protein
MKWGIRQTHDKWGRSMRGRKKQWRGAVIISRLRSRVTACGFSEVESRLAASQK